MCNLRLAEHSAFHMVKESSGQCFNECVLRHEGVRRDNLGLDPISVVADPLAAIDDLLNTVRNHCVPPLNFGGKEKTVVFVRHL